MNMIKSLDIDTKEDLMLSRLILKTLKHEN